MGRASELCIAAVLFFALGSCIDNGAGTNPGIGTQPENCANGVDDNGDLRTDCEDDACRFHPACTGAQEICDNGLDDDGDGRVDCADRNCLGDSACLRPENCSNGIDDNGNAAVDCADPYCFNNIACPARETNCGDGIDNDADSFKDCADVDCFEACRGGESCWNGIDDEGDGKVDCTDPDCIDDVTCSLREICDDGFDNNRDGLADCADPECFGDPSCAPRELCSNGLDDDGDGKVDCEDLECKPLPQCGSYAAEICDNQRDDDRDGLSDCRDPICASHRACGGSACAHVDLPGQLGPGIFHGTTVGKPNILSSSCRSSLAGEVIVTWAAPADGSYRFDTFGSAFDTVLYVVDGGCAGPELACKDDAVPGRNARSEVTVNLRENQVIAIVIDGFDLAAGAVVLNAYSARAITEAGMCRDGIDNDGDGRRDCVDPACQLSRACGGKGCPDESLHNQLGQYIARGSTTGRKDDVGPTCAFSTSPDVAYQWVAPAEGIYTFTTEGSGFDTVLYALDVDCRGRELACNDDMSLEARSGSSRLALPLLRGQWITLVIDGYGTTTGDYVLSVFPPGGGFESDNCRDDLDNDGDGKVDCADPDCMFDVLCR